MHVNSEGWVEPCIFTHFATDNIHDTSLADAFNSPYFREIRRRQPFSHNLLKPCMLIDNPEQSREIMALTGAQPTHPGAESLFTELRADIDEYAAEVERVYAPVWSCTVGQEAREGGRRGGPLRLRRRAVGSVPGALQAPGTRRSGVRRRAAGESASPLSGGLDASAGACRAATAG